MTGAGIGPSAEAATPGWPAVTLAEADARLCAPGERFEIEVVDVAGRPVRTWKHLPRNLADLARTTRERHGDRLFVIYEDERVTYDAWFRASATLAAEMRRVGVEKGDRVALAMRNLPEWPVVFFAALACGAIVVPLNAWLTGSELQYGLEQSGAKLLVCDAERFGRVEPVLANLPTMEHVMVARSGEYDCRTRSLESIIGTPRAYHALPDQPLPEVAIEPDDDATIFYTSGTTGKAKGALGTHRNVLCGLLALDYIGQRTLVRRGEAPTIPAPGTILVAIPMFHVTACCSTLMSALRTGSTMVFMYRWDARKALELIEREKVTSTGGVPTIVWQLLEHPDRPTFNLNSLESVSYGGAPAAPELVRRIASDLGLVPVTGWGMTETSATVTGHADEDYRRRPESCGPALPVSAIRIMSEDGAHEVSVGEIGELWATGPQVVKGYWDDPGATARTFVNGWVRTGDIARLDEEGFCTIVDRAKDVIIRGGENIYSTEVESVLFEHPAVIDAALIGLPHRTLGEEPAAVVHLAPGRAGNEAELQTWMRDRLAAFKVPVRIVFCETMLPRNANGKILKKQLAALFDEPQTSGAT